MVAKRLFSCLHFCSKALLQKCKQEKRRFATITAYDYSFAKLFAEEGINVMLVGDSLGMTVQGHDSTPSLFLFAFLQ